MSELKELLQDLTAEEVADLLEQVVAKREEKNKPKIRRRGRIIQEEEQPERPKARKTNRRKKSRFDDDLPRGRIGRKKKKKRGNKPPIIQNVETGKDRNRFLERDDLREACQEDKKIDAGLNKNRRPVERGVARTIVVDCYRCDEEYEVHPSLMYKDPEEGWIYICDECARRN